METASWILSLCRSPLVMKFPRMASLTCRAITRHCSTRMRIRHRTRHTGEMTVFSITGPLTYLKSHINRLAIGRERTTQQAWRSEPPFWPAASIIPPRWTSKKMHLQWLKKSRHLTAECQLAMVLPSSTPTSSWRDASMPRTLGTPTPSCQECWAPGPPSPNTLMRARLTT